jgi:hypothetical protein
MTTVVSRRNAVAGFATIGRSLGQGVAKGTRTVQATTVRPHRHMRSRHRRWGCWWQRGSPLVALGTSPLRPALGDVKEMFLQMSDHA